MLYECRNKAKTVAYYGFAFALPLVCFFILLAVGGIYPFGDESFLTEDLKYQYVDFFTWYQSVLQGKGSLFYSFATGLGSNAWGMVGYYLASPLNLLIVFFDAGHITDFVVLVVALKLGFSGTTTAWYARRRFCLDAPMALALSLAFVMSAWTVSNLRNPLWLDALVFLPLAAMGVRRFVAQGRRGLLIGALAAQVAINWYMGYMTVLFGSLLFAVEWATASSDERYTARVSRAFTEFLACVAVAVFLAFGVFLPSVASLLGSWGMPYALAAGLAAVVLLAVSLRALFHGFSDRTCRAITGIVIGALCALVLAGAIYLAVTGKLLKSYGFTVVARALVDPSYTRDVSPQIFPGVLAWVLSIVFFASKRVPRTKRIALGLLLAVMLASAWLKALEIVWCGFHQPSGFYCRVAWLIHFVFFLLSCEGACVLQRKWFAFPRRTGVAAVASLALAIGGCLGVGAAMLPTLYNGYTQTQHDAYVHDSRAQYDQLQGLDSSWYRTEKTYVRAGISALNEGLATGARGIAAYSSATDPQAALFLKRLGYANDQEENSRIVTYESPLLVTDSLFGVKYVSTQASAPLYRETGLPAVDGYPSWKENPYALSLGFAASSDVLAADVSKAANPFEAQNQLASALIGEPVQLYTPVAAQRVDSGQGSTWSFTTPAGSLSYIYLTDDQRNADTSLGLNILTDGGANRYMENWFTGHSILVVDAAVPSQDCAHGVTVQMATASDNPTLEGVDCFVYALDVDAWNALYEKLASQQMSVTSASDGDVSGSYAAADDGWLLLSMPYDEGWTVQVNGETVKASPAFGGGMMAVPVQKGDNELRMSYVSPGFFEGLGITVVTGVSLGLLAARKRHDLGNRKGSK